MYSSFGAQLVALTWILMLKYVHSSYKEQVHDTLAATDGANPSTGFSIHRSLNHESAASTDLSKLKLAFIVDEKIDANRDSYVQLNELVQWLRSRHKNYYQEDANRHWATFEKSIEGRLSWKEYAKKEYDHFDALLSQSGSEDRMANLKKSYDYHVHRDVRRWREADKNHDGDLSQDEFMLFMHPEYSEEMLDVVVDEKFELMDKNNDSRISFEEFIARSGPDNKSTQQGQYDQWVKLEESKFHSRLDSNNDGFLDKKEIASLVTPSELQEQSLTEAQQLLRLADQNRDHRLTKGEILAAYYEFVNSHATDFGELLTDTNIKSHDEL